MKNSSPNFPGGFCVLIAVYRNDNVNLFHLALSSIFGNTLKPNQVVLVGDGPLDEQHYQIIKKFSDQYHDVFEYHELPMNIGLAGALNHGLNFVSTQWVIRADSDDFNLPNRFVKQAEYLYSHPDVDIFGGAILEVDELNCPLARRSVPTNYDTLKKFALLRSPFNHMTVCFNKSVVMACGGYPNIFLKEDYGLWIIALSKGYMIGNLDEVLVRATTGFGMYRRRGGLKYVLSEYHLQCLFYNTGLKSLSRAFFDFVLRSFVFIVPNRFRQFIYVTFLRE